METKDYIGKVVKVHYICNGEEQYKVGIVFEQERGRSNNARLSMLLTNGNIWSLPSSENIIRITSARIDENLRKSLVNYFNAKKAQNKFLDNFWKEKTMHESRVMAAQNAVREISGTLSFDDFIKTVEKLFAERYPSTYSDSDRYFLCHGVSGDSVSVSHIQEIMKYATPEIFNFLYREYDNNIFVDESTPGYKEFCEKNAPPEIASLRGKAKMSVHASIGDKNFLSVHRIYELPIKHGMTRQSLNEIKELLYSEKTAAKPHAALADQINAAALRTRTSKTKTKEQMHEL